MKQSGGLPWLWGRGTCLHKHKGSHQGWELQTETVGWASSIKPKKSPWLLQTAKIAWSFTSKVTSSMWQATVREGIQCNACHTDEECLIRCHFRKGLIYLILSLRTTKKQLHFKVPTLPWGMGERQLQKSVAERVQAIHRPPEKFKLK